MRHELTTSIRFEFESPIDQEILSSGTRRKLLIEQLLGSQTHNQYSRRKENNVKAAFRQYGVDFVLAHCPIVVCEICCQANGEPMFVVIDGHHRARFAPLFKAKQVECIVLSPDNYAVHVQQDQDLAISSLLSAVNEALHDFGRRTW